MIGVLNWLKFKVKSWGVIINNVSEFITVFSFDEEASLVILFFKDCNTESPLLYIDYILYRYNGAI